MLLRQLFDHETWTYTYLLGDEETGEAKLGLQFVDLTGDAGNDWFYRVVATNGTCEGP